MAKNKIDTRNVNTKLRSLGFLFPGTESELQKFEEFTNNYEFQLSKSDIDPNKILKIIRTKDITKPSNTKLNVFDFTTDKNINATKNKILGIDYYKRMVLAAEIVDQLHMGKRFGHVKLQKLIFLCQKTGNMNLPTNFLKQAMGPYDPKMMRSIDSQLVKKKWFKFVKSADLKYQPLENAGSHKKDYSKYFCDYLDKISYLIETFRNSKTKEVEIVATIYACCESLLTTNNSVTSEKLVSDFFNWSAEKSKFSKEEVKETILWMEAENIVPQTPNL